MLMTTASAALVMRAASPIIKDLYDGAKDATKAALKNWRSDRFPEKLLNTLLELDNVRTIWSPEKNISLRDFYYPSKIKTTDGAERIEYVSDLGTGCFVVQGIVGQGKSILLRYLAMQELSHPSKPRIPLFFELRKLSKTLSLKDALTRTLTACDIDVDDAVFDYLASSGRLVVLLDGFDELESEIIKSTTIDIEELTTRHPKLQIIVSSRPDNEIQKLSRFHVTDIYPLTTDDYEPFLKKLNVDIEKVIAIVDAIKESPSNVANLISTPLMLTLVLMVYQSESQIPAELPEFFEKLFYTVFTRHDKLKPTFERKHYSNLSEKKLQELFEAFCFMAMQAGHGRTLNLSQFSESFEIAQECVKGSDCTEDGFRKDITKVSCLMLEEGFQDVTFLHKSIAEYHAAAFVKSSGDDFAKRFYAIAAKEWTYWKECLLFLRSIDKYRFSKFFAIKNLTSAITTIEKVTIAQTGSEFVKALPKWMSSVRIHYRLHDPDIESDIDDVSEFDPEHIGAYRLALFGSWDSPNNYYLQYFPQSISTAALTTGPEFLRKEEIQQLISEGIQVKRPHKYEIEIGLADALDRWGVEKLRAEVSSFLFQLQRQLDEAKQTASTSEKRIMIFSRKRDTSRDGH